MRRRRSQRDESLEIILELTEQFWQVGTVAATGFILLAALAFRWTKHCLAVAEASPLLAPMVSSYGWLLYGFPFILLCMAWLFGTKALGSYKKERSF